MHLAGFVVENDSRRSGVLTALLLKTLDSLEVHTASI